MDRQSLNYKGVNIYENNPVVPVRNRSVELHVSSNMFGQILEVEETILELELKDILNSDESFHHSPLRKSPLRFRLFSSLKSHKLDPAPLPVDR